MFVIMSPKDSDESNTARIGRLWEPYIKPTVTGVSRENPAYWLAHTMRATHAI